MVQKAHRQPPLVLFSLDRDDCADAVGFVPHPHAQQRVAGTRTLARAGGTTWFAPRVTGCGPFADAYSVMNNWSANHGAISYGHIGADLLALAATLRIPVAMHNVAEEAVFRPSTWGLCGALEPQAADYRACANFGPLYS